MAPATSSEWVRCETQIRSAHSSTAAVESSSTADVSSAATFEYAWLPNCPMSDPSQSTTSNAIDCAAAHSCADPKWINMSLYALQLTDASGKPVNGAWQYVQSQCRPPQLATTGAAAVPVRTLTWQDVLAAIRRVGLPDSRVEAPHYTLVNLRTTFYTRPHPLGRAMTIVGFGVDLQTRPTQYTWHWGDGSTDTTTTPGQPYPSKEVTHTYRHATHRGPGMALSVDVTYTARYRVDGGAWQTVPDTLTIPGAATLLPVKEASAVLVADD